VQTQSSTQVAPGPCLVLASSKSLTAAFTCSPYRVADWTGYPIALREFPDLGESTALVRSRFGDIRTLRKTRPSALRGALGSGLGPEYCKCSWVRGPRGAEYGVWRAPSPDIDQIDSSFKFSLHFPQHMSKMCHYIKLERFNKTGIDEAPGHFQIIL
jgi:hypothetical protein